VIGRILLYEVYFATTGSQPITYTAK